MLEKKKRGAGAGNELVGVERRLAEQRKGLPERRSPEHGGERGSCVVRYHVEKMFLVYSYHRRGSNIYKS